MLALCAEGDGFEPRLGLTKYIKNEDTVSTAMSKGFSSGYVLACRFCSSLHTQSLECVVSIMASLSLA